MLGNITHSFRLNSTIALLQPPPEVIDLFDDIMLLSEGTMVFHVRSRLLCRCELEMIHLCACSARWLSF